MKIRFTNLTLKAPSKFVADNILDFALFFREQSARQSTHIIFEKKVMFI